jgi:hypothetical protein
MTESSPIAAPPVSAPTQSLPPGFTFAVPKGDEMWSQWYKEANDTFKEFASFDPSSAVAKDKDGTPVRALSQRQISGQFDDEVAKSWEEDWEDEDVDDSYDAVMGKISRFVASNAAHVAPAK